VKFSLVRVPESARNEAVFLNMLAGPKSELQESKETWLAPVFGRGRVLGAWPAEGFGDEQIEEVTLFLLGACSCQVKNLNPGWDLLLQVDWDEELYKIGFQTTAEQTLRPGEPQQAAAAPETVTFSGGEQKRTSSITRRQALGLGGSTLLLLAAGALAWRQFVR